MKLIKDGAAITPDWQLAAEPDITATAARKILSLDELLSISQADEPSGPLGVLIEADVDLELLSPLLSRLDLILIRFTSFADGRGFSLARRLRSSARFTGALWVGGQLIADQYPLALQCGFDAVLVSDEQLKRQPARDWKAALANAPKPYPQRVGAASAADNNNAPPVISLSSAVAHQAERLNEKFTPLPTRQLLEYAINDAFAGRIALVSSFGAESAVLLHLVADIAPQTPVLFIDTGQLFAETLTYQQELVTALKLQDVRIIRPVATQVKSHDPQGRLWQSDASTCCDLRKTEPLEQALDEFPAWISGRKAFQGAGRSALQLFEVANGRIKINPLAGWQPAEVLSYMQQHQLPPHPLYAKGYLSIGCAPCTTPVCAGEDARAGRWRGSSKTECGIHLVNGALRRAG